MDKKHENTYFKIINRIPKNELKGKSSTIIQEINSIKEYLEKTNPSNYNGVTIKQLKPPLYPLYEAYIGDKALRLTFCINLNTNKITLKNLMTRSRLLGR